MRSNRFLEFGERHQTIAQWAREIGLSPSTIWGRIERGWTTKEALNVNTQGKVFIEYQGYRRDKKSWSKITGQTVANISNGLHKGWPPDKILVLSRERLEDRLKSAEITLRKYANGARDPNHAKKYFRKYREFDWAVMTYERP